MKTNKEIASLFSGGKFTEVIDSMDENIEWNIYENDMNLNGKDAVLQFCKNVAEYFKSVAIKFEMLGMLEDANKISIYGRAEFIKEAVTVNTVHSCDVYEFDEHSQIIKIYSYCNSSKPDK